MANNTFEFIGKLSIGKESDKFKPFEEKVSAKGWKMANLNFNVVAGDNRHFLQVKGGHWADGHGEIYSFSKGSTDEQGNRIKGESIKIPWNDRFNQETLDQVAEFKKFVIDLEEYGCRYNLKKAFEKLESADLEEEDIEQLKIEELDLAMDIKSKKEVLKQAIEKSNKKRKEFLSEMDYAEYLHKLIKSEKLKDRMFIVKGEFQYSEYNGKIYKNMVPTRIYLAKQDSEPLSIGQLTVYFKKNCVEEIKDKNIIKVYTRSYDNNRKETIPVPTTLVINNPKDETDEKKVKLRKLLIGQFTVKDKSWKELGVKVKLLNGSQKVEITPDMLTDFQKEMLELDPDFIHDIRKDLGGDIYGKKVEETEVINVARGYSKGRKDTLYKDKDFIIQEIEIKDDTLQSKDKSDDDDIFDIDIDL